MVEGARLESVFRGNSNEGSNPSLSASSNWLSLKDLAIFGEVCLYPFLYQKSV